MAWLSASGLSWDALQVFAWAKMSVDNSRDVSMIQAVGKTMADAPCPLCRVAQEGRKQTEQTPLAGRELLKAKAKCPTTLWGDGFSALGVAAFPFARPTDVGAVSLPSEVPVPPPRVLG